MNKPKQEMTVVSNNRKIRRQMAKAEGKFIPAKKFRGPNRNKQNGGKWEGMYEPYNRYCRENKLSLRMHTESEVKVYEVRYCKGKKKRKAA